MPGSYRQEVQTQRNRQLSENAPFGKTPGRVQSSESYNRLSTCPMGRAKCVFENRGRVDRVSRQVSKPKSAPTSVNHLRSNAPLTVKSAKAFVRFFAVPSRARSPTLSPTLTPPPPDNFHKAREKKLRRLQKTMSTYAPRGVMRTRRRARFLAPIRAAPPLVISPRPRRGPP